MQRHTLLIIGILFLGFDSTAQYVEQAITSGVDHRHVDNNQIGGGIAVFDLNNDGFEDLYLTGGTESDKLYLNDGDGTFTDISASSAILSIAGIKTVGVTTGDIDNDGDRDIFVTTFRTNHNILFLNNGDSTFSDISVSAGITDSTWSSSVTMGDYNNDGYLDIYVANYAEYATNPFFLSISSGIANTLYMNNGDLTFTDVSTSSGTANIGTSLAAAFTDFDRDQDVDILLGNDFGYNYEPNALYQNNYPTNDFNDIAVGSFTNDEIDAMGIAIGDFDEDGDFDYYISNMMDNLLHVRNPGINFTESAFAALVQVDSLVSWGTFFFDYENDTYLDLFVANGGVMNVSEPQENTLFENQQNGTFQNIALPSGIDSIRRSRGAVYGDFNNDGSLDLVVANVGPNYSTSYSTSLYESTDLFGNHWVSFNLSGTYCNADAFGAHVTLHSNGRSWIREIGGGSSYLSQNSSRAHFGLGTYTSIDSVVVEWPGGGQDAYLGLGIDQLHALTQQTTSLSSLDLTTHFTVYPNPTSSSVSILHSEITGGSIELISQNGQVLLSKECSGVKSNLDLSSLSPGIYFVRLNTDMKTSVQKLVKF